jgi:hypothetical protein
VLYFHNPVAVGPACRRGNLVVGPTGTLERCVQRQLALAPAGHPLPAMDDADVRHRLSAGSGGLGLALDRPGRCFRYRLVRRRRLSQAGTRLHRTILARRASVEFDAPRQTVDLWLAGLPGDPKPVLQALVNLMTSRSLFKPLAFDRRIE